MSELLYGAPAAQAILDSLEARIAALRTRGREPCLAMLRCGEDPGALSYERAAARSCAKAGIRVQNIVLPWTAGTEELLQAVDRVNGDKNVHGILVLRPLPGQIDTQVIFRRLRHDKDVDGIIDFDKLTQDPSNPKALLPAYSSDGLHGTPAAYEAMGKLAAEMIK